MSDEEIEEFVPEWYPYEEGGTIGESGPEGGFILRDEEWGDPDDEEDADARLTLEQGRAQNPGFFVSATLYGWMFHTHRLSTSQTDAEAAYDAMKPALEALTALLPYEGERDVSGKAQRLMAAVAAFEGQYP